ncbi:MAG: polymer-forming cytoskeletal protein [Pyrinomonadaceae bacterium]
MLELKKTPQLLSLLAPPSELHSEKTLEQPSLQDPFDPALPFARWVEDLKPSPKQVASESAETQEDNSDIYIGSFPGSNCEVTFEGVLHFDGYSIGNIRSPAGTLVLTKRGRIEADIDVGIAVINGSVTGNINAAERVVLDRDARVTGQIHTRLLTVRLGAVFDGDCLFVPTTESLTEKPKAKSKAAGA